MGLKSVRRAAGMGARVAGRSTGRGVGRGSEATVRGSGGVNHRSKAVSVIVNSTDASIGT